jgi:hypothetical protein
MDVAAYNRVAWNKESRAGSRCQLLLECNDETVLGVPQKAWEFLLRH